MSKICTTLTSYNSFRIPSTVNNHQLPATLCYLYNVVITSVEATVALFLASSPIFTVNMIIHKPFHLDGKNFARTCIMSISESLSNIKVIS